jgi:hypothetical protein
MRTAGTILFAIIVFIYAANPAINFKPFSVKLETPYVSFGILFLIISLILFQIQSEKSGYKKGFEAGVKKSIELIESFNSEK